MICLMWFIWNYIKSLVNLLTNQIKNMIKFIMLDESKNIEVQLTKRSIFPELHCQLGNNLLFEVLVTWTKSKNNSK